FNISLINTNDIFSYITKISLQAVTRGENEKQNYFNSSRAVKTKSKMALHRRHW
ncbi:hypothetical protein HMPREF9073_00431, partial [Capnocytophaga sp. oral taxon 326 str. F0382]